MSSPGAIINASGDFEENVERLARHLGRDRNRRAVFDLIYGRGSRHRSKKQIAEELGISGTAQVVQNALDHLAKHQLIVRVENDGHVRDGSRWVYGKERFVQANRVTIRRYADDPGAAKKVATKRRPAVTVNISLVRPSTHGTAGAKRTSRAAKRPPRLRLALLVTNPTAAGPLQTGYEARYIEEAIALANRVDDVALRLVLAPTLSTLLDMLNRFRPDIIHFSGHGGGPTLLLDNEQAGDTGETVLDFDQVARVIGSTSAKPKLMVLAACDTLDGADRFLTEVPAIVAMAAAIDDTAACEFSRQLYRSIFGSATVVQALEQARLVLESKGYADASLPTLVTRHEAAANQTLI